MSATLPKSTSNTVATRLRTKRDLETTMNTLKRLLQPTFSKKGSRKKNKPRSLAKKVLPPKKTIKHFDNFSEDDGEYYPNKLKRKVEEKKTVLKPTHKLKVVVAMNKRKRLTPHKGVEQIYEESLSNQDIPKLDNVHTETGNLNVHSAPGSNVRTAPIYTKTDNLNVHTAPNNTNVHTEPDLKVQTPPLTSKSDIYELISPPHKSLTELTVDDLIRMDEDSLSDEDLMEILTCPSPVWWEDPSSEYRGTLYLTTTSEVLEPIDDSKKNIELKTYSNKKGVGIEKTGTLSVSVGKANKIEKLENLLSHIRSLERIDDKVIKKSLKNNDSISKDDKKFELKDKYNNNKEIEMKFDDDLSKRRTISSSGSEISVNEDDLLRNLENIDIPIQKLNTNYLGDVQNNVNEMITVDNDNDNEIPIDNNDLQNNVLKETPENEIVKAIIETKDNNYDISPVSKKTNKYNKKHNKDSNKSVFNKTKGLNTLLDSNKEAYKPDNEEMASNITSILKKLKPSDDILDVRLIKVPTNVTNEVKIWSKLENFKRHTFKPVHFENEVIDIEDELDFSIIENSPNKERDPLDTRDDAIIIDDDSNDALNGKSMFNDIINLDVIQQCNDVTITAIENDDSSQNSVTEIDPKVIYDNDIIKEDTIRIGNDLDVRLIETSIPNTKRKRKTVLKLDKNENKKKKSNDINTENTLPETFESIQLYDTATEINPKWHINNYLQYGEESNERGIFRVLDTDDTSDTILRLNDDVDVSLVKNPRSNDEANVSVNETKNNDLSITLVNKSNVDVTITPIALPTLTKNPKPTFESPISIKSVNSEGVEYSEGTISDTNIHFLDEYKSDEFEINSLNIGIAKGSVVKNIADLDADNKTQELDQNEIDMNITDLDIAEQTISEDDLHKVKIIDEGESIVQDLNESENSEVKSDETKELHNLRDNIIDSLNEK